MSATADSGPKASGDPSRRRAFELLDAVLAVPPPARQAMLAEACGGDRKLCREVESLLALEAEAEGFLSRPALEDRSAEDLPAIGGGRYRPVEKLGAGGMGVVYRAVDQRLERPVAVKRLRRLPGDRQARRRFLREARAAARLSHPAVVQIHDILEEDDELWIVMELVPGEPLADRLAGGPLAVSRALSLAWEIAGGLAEAHAHGVLHRDLKSTNVMLTPAGRASAGRAKILDFGLAKLLASEDQSASVTGGLFGTPHAMSPEQVTRRPLDHRSDLFSFGALLYEMVTGEIPFRGSDPLEAMDRVCHLCPPPAHERNPAVPAELSWLIDSLLQKDPARRPAETTTVLRALERIIESAPERPAAAAAEPGAEPAEEQGERRQLTVLSCQLMAASEVAKPLDPEELIRVRPAFRQLAGEVLDRHGAHRGPPLDDGFLAYFGYPRARRDDERRAVAAALDLAAAAEGLSLGAGDETAGVTMRIGVHTGPVVTARLEDGSEEIVLGHTGCQVGAMRNLSPTAGVVMSAATHRLIGGDFVTEPLGTFRLPCCLRSVAAFRALAATGAERATGALPLVGRERELELIAGRFRESVRGRGQVVHLSGGAGIGKSRLVRALRDRLEGPLTWLQGSCAAAAHPTPFAPFRPLLRQLRSLPPAADGDPSPGLEVSMSSSGGSLSTPEPEARRQALEAMAMRVLEHTERQPVILVVEDVQWADASSLDLLELLVEQAPVFRLLILLSFAPGCDLPWQERPQVTFCPLRRLTDDQAAEMIGGITGGRTLPAEIAERILSQADGVPLFVEELTRMVLESESLVTRGDRFELVGSPPARAVPDTLRSRLTARLDRLGSVRSVAQAASVLGREFTAELLGAVTSLRIEDLEQALDRLEKARILHRCGSHRRTRYRFRHALVRDTAYASLLDEQRRRLERRAASWSPR